MMSRGNAELNLEKFKCIHPCGEYADRTSEMVDEIRRSNMRDSRFFDPWMDAVERELSRHPEGARPTENVRLLVRVNDDKIVGLHEIRGGDLANVGKLGGNISYFIRPTERRKGYNKVNLYFALKECRELGLNSIYMVCLSGDRASERSVLSMNGHMLRERYDDVTGLQVKEFVIDVNEAITEYEPYLEMVIEK